MEYNDVFYKRFEDSINDDAIEWIVKNRKTNPKAKEIYDIIMKIA